MQGSDTTLIDEMTRMIIRPHRDIYHPERLGPTQFVVKGKAKTDRTHKYIEVNRRDMVVDCKGKKIQLSLFSPVDHEAKRNQSGMRFTGFGRGEKKGRKCVVYLHANSGSRIEGIDVVKYVLPFGWSMAIFDYRGSGLSQGEYTSMGVNQSEDLQRVLQYLSQTQQFSQFSLWGRSMGAVTILYYLTKHYYLSFLKDGVTVGAVVLDSPFANMQRLMYEIGSSNIKLPEFVFLPIVSSIGERVKGKIGVDLLKELNLVDRIKEIKESNKQVYGVISKIGGLFLTSSEDKLVHSSHVQLLHQEFPFHPNQLQYYHGQHNETRSDAVKTKCAAFLCEENQKIAQEEHHGESYGGNQHGKTAPGYRHSDYGGKVPKNNGEEREMGFLLPPQVRKPEVVSPKIQKTKLAEQRMQKQLSKASKLIEGERQFASEHRIETSPIQSPLSQSLSQPPTLTQSPVSQSLSQSTTQSMLSQPPQLQPTIIINHNYNVSVNLYEPRASIQLVQQMIPPINFKVLGQQGNMSDRFETHLGHNRYYMPYAAKMEKRNQCGSSFTNIPLSESYYGGPVGSFTHASTGKSMIVSNKVDHTQNSGKKGMGSEGKIEIPLIKFEGMGFDGYGQSQFHNRAHKGPEPLERQLERMKSDRQSKSFMLSPNMRQCETGARQNDQRQSDQHERQKVSLAELRRMQKEEQEKCVMQASRIIAVKERHDRMDDFEKINLKKEVYAEENWKYRSQEWQDKQRPMKTSLMAKRKVDRKNSETASNNVKASVIGKKYLEEKICELGNSQSVNSPKLLQVRGKS